MGEELGVTTDLDAPLGFGRPTQLRLNCETLATSSASSGSSTVASGRREQTASEPVNTYLSASRPRRILEMTRL
jgi:hypothetical protein